jgi:hypothetical protein
MDDVTIRALLSRFIKQALNDARSEAVDDDAFTEALASAAWNSLIYLLRQSFLQQTRINLEQVGEFVNESGKWTFHPAASLAEADVFRLPPTEARKQMARLALFHLDQGMELARGIPKDVENPRAAKSWEYSPMQRSDDPQATLSRELRQVALEVLRINRNLKAERSFDFPFSSQAAKEIPSFGPPGPIYMPIEKITGKTTDFKFDEPEDVTDVARSDFALDE